MHFLAFGRNQLVLLEAGEYAGHGFHRQAQVVADFVARHAQAELVSREASGAETRGEVDQEGGDPFVGGFLREQQHHLLVVANFPAHHAHQLAAQLRQLQGQFIQALERDFTHRGGFQGLGRHRVNLGVHARQPDQLAGQVETGDLFFAAIAQAEGFQRARTYCINGLKLVALAKQELTFFQRATTFNNLVQRFHVFQIQRKWQAEGGQAAILAMSLAMSAQFNWLGHFLNPCGKTHIRRKGTALGDDPASVYT